MSINQTNLTKFEIHLIMSRLRTGETDWVKIYNEIVEIRNNLAKQDEAKSK